MPSSSRITVYLQSAAKGEPHEDFVKLQDDQAAFKAFERKWGPLDEGGLWGGYGFGFGMRDILRSAWRGDEAALQEIQRWINKFMTMGFQYTKGRIEIVPRQLLGTIFILFFRDHASGRTAICANPDCPEPYFLRAKHVQKYCGLPKCTEYAQRNYGRNWWREHRAHTEWRKP